MQEMNVLLGALAISLNLVAMVAMKFKGVKMRGA